MSMYSIALAPFQATCSAPSSVGRSTNRILDIADEETPADDSSKDFTSFLGSRSASSSFETAEQRGDELPCSTQPLQRRSARSVFLTNNDLIHD